MKYKSNKGFTHGQPDKIGVLVTNLGTPEAPTKQALRPYLKEFLSDPRVVEEAALAIEPFRSSPHRKVVQASRPPRNVSRMR